MKTDTPHTNTDKPLVPQLRFAEFEGEWEIIKFDKYCKFQQGVQVDVELQKTEPYEDFIRFLRIENYTQNSDDFRFIPNNYNKTKVIDKNDIVVVRYGATAGFIGRGIDGVLANNLFKIIPNSSFFDNDYLFHYLKSYKAFHFFQSEMSGGAMPALSFGIVKALKIPLTKIPEQQKIAGFLTAVDTKIQQLTQKKEFLEQYKKGVMQQLFSQKLRFKIKNEVGELVEPPDWKEKKLKNLVEKERKIRYGIVQPGKYDSKGRFMIRGQDYSSVKGWADSSEFFRVSEEVEKKYKKARVKTGDLLITIVGAGTGWLEVVPDFLDGANITQTTGRIAINKSITSPGYVKNYFLSYLGRKEINKYIKGQAQPGLNIGDVEKFLLPLPCLEEQQKIANYLSALDTKIESVTQQITQTQQFKKGLLQQLFV